MATRQKIRSNTHRRIAGVLLITAIAGATGCAVDPVFAHRFDHCMSYWNAQERRDLRMTVMPEGEGKVDYCVDWANDGVGVGILTATNSSQVPATKREG